MNGNNSIGKRIKTWISRVLLCVLTLVLSAVAVLMLAMNVICNGGSESAKKMFVTTILETGALKFLASVYLSKDEISSIVAENTMAEFNDQVDTELITFVGNNIDAKEKNTLGAVSQDISTFTISDAVIGNHETVEIDEDGDGIIIYDVVGRTFYGKMMVILDPSRVMLASYYNDHKKGAPLDEIINEVSGVAGINGGLYAQSEAGGRPYGTVVSNGDIQINKPQDKDGLVFIGLTENDILVIEDLSGMSAKDFEKLVADKKIRDGCCFQEESKDKNNHFVQLVINGVGRELNSGMGSGLNPRTAIGQRADGAILFLVTDGRGASGHLGASASDLIEIMLEYGAVNAANLDGGSSSSMVLYDEYLMESVTFRKPNTSWNLPIGFVVK